MKVAAPTDRKGIIRLLCQHAPIYDKEAARRVADLVIRLRELEQQQYSPANNAEQQELNTALFEPMKKLGLHQLELTTCDDHLINFVEQVLADGLHFGLYGLWADAHREGSGASASKGKRGKRR